jgi:hypothetical protein
MQTAGEWAVNRGCAASLPVLKAHLFAAVRPRPGWADVSATCRDRLPGAASIRPPTRAARQKLPSKRTIPFFCTSLLRLVVEPVLEHPTIRTAAKTNEAERNNFMFDHLLSKPSGYLPSFRAQHSGGNEEPRIVTKNCRQTHKPSADDLRILSTERSSLLARRTAARAGIPLQPSWR